MNHSNVLCLECAPDNHSAMSTSAFLGLLEEGPLHEVRARGIAESPQSCELSCVRFSPDGDMILSNIS